MVVNEFDGGEGEGCDVEGVEVKVCGGDGEKCVRCWHVLRDVNTDR